MKKRQITYKKGFTLIELLVVIAIIASLAAISIPIGMRVYNNALEVKAKAHMKIFVDGANRFKKDHGTLTNGSMVLGGIDQVLWTAHNRWNYQATNSNNYSFQFNAGWQFLNVLGGADDDRAKEFSDRKLVYVKLPSADESNGYTGGWTRNSTTDLIHGLLDPWGRSYIMVMDGNYDRTVIRSGYYMGAYSNKDLVIEGGVGLISPGTNADNLNRAAGATADDLASWE